MSTIATLLSSISALFNPLITMATGNTYIGGLVIFSIGLTIVGSVLHFFIART